MTEILRWISRAGEIEKRQFPCTQEQEPHRPQQLRPSPCLRIPFAVMDLPPSVLNLPSPGSRYRPLQPCFVVRGLQDCTGQSSSGPHISSASLPFLCCRTDWDRAARLLQLRSHPVLLNLLPPPCSHPRAHRGGKRPILYLTTATMKSSGPMTRTWLAAVPLSRGK